MTEHVAAGLRRELEAATPDAWARVARTIRAREIAAGLLAALDRPPSSHSRLGRELRLSLPEGVMSEAA